MHRSDYEDHAAGAIVPPRTHFDTVRGVRRRNVKPLQIYPVLPHQAGWLMLHEECLKENDSPYKKILASECLQSHCIAAFSRALPEYLNAWGAENLHEFLSTYPADELTALSVHCQLNQVDMTSDLAYVLACHPQVDRLVLNASNLSHVAVCRALYSQGGECELFHRQLDDYDELALVLGCHPLLDRWAEDVSRGVIFKNTSRGCGCRLTRLELWNAKWSPFDLKLCLEHCPRLTHLSLSHFSPRSDNSSDVSSRIIETLLLWSPNLQVLDLSYCNWLTDSMLEFLVHRKCNTLKMVNVVGCCRVNMWTCIKLKNECCGRIVISSRRQVWKR